MAKQSDNDLLRGVLRLWRVVWRWSLPLGLLAGLAWAIAVTRAKALPERHSILEQLQESPRQSVADVPKFNFEWYGTKFLVQPRAAYSLRGLIVSHNDPAGWGDIYHDEKSVDLRDLCVVWGSNVRTGGYSMVSYRSEPWTCFVSWKTEEAGLNFEMTELSNNHILAGSDKVANTVSTVEIGDQVEMEGFLVDYHPASDPDLVRRTSLTREDTGNGACEVFFVTGMRVLKTANDGWRKVRRLGRSACLGLLGWWVFSLVVFPYLEYRFL